MERDMDKLITVKDVSERYSCSLPTARKYIRQCNPHMENPLVTYDWAFREWEKSRLKCASPESMSAKQFKKLQESIEKGARYIVPRER